MIWKYREEYIYNILHGSHWGTHLVVDSALALRLVDKRTELAWLFSWAGQLPVTPTGDHSLYLVFTYDGYLAASLSAD